jgi:hypothetical protein
MFSIPATLSQVKVVQPTPEEVLRQTKEENAVDSTLHIDPKIFHEALAVIRYRLEAENRMTLASALNPDHTELHHNKWVQKVKNDPQYRVLGSEKQLVTELREKTGVPSLYLEIELLEADQLQSDSVPYTQMEKLEKMKEKNEHLESFLRRFNANIQYD